MDLDCHSIKMENSGLSSEHQTFFGFEFGIGLNVKEDNQITNKMITLLKTHRFSSFPEHSYEREREKVVVERNDHGKLDYPNLRR